MRRDRYTALAKKLQPHLSPARISTTIVTGGGGGGGDHVHSFEDLDGELSPSQAPWIATDYVNVTGDTMTGTLSINAATQLQLQASGTNRASFIATATSLDISPLPTSPAASDIRLFTNTNTTGTKRLVLNTGDGTGTVAHQISTNSTTIFNAQAANIDFNIRGDTDTTLFYLDASADSIGIGNNLPSYKLDVNGTMRAVTSLTTPLITTATNIDLVINPAGTGAVQFPNEQKLRTSTFDGWAIPHTTGWQINEYAPAPGISASVLTIGRIQADELDVRVFVANETRVDRGDEFWTKSFGIVAENFTTPSALAGTVTVKFEDSPALVGAIFSNNDWVMIRKLEISTGLSLYTIWGQVSGYVNNGDGTQSWTFTLRGGPTSKAIGRGSLGIDFGAAGAGLIHLSVVDASGSPYIKLRKWIGSDPMSAPNFTTYVQLGNLGSIGNSLYTPAGFGIYIRSTIDEGRFLVADDNGLQIRGADFAIYDGADQTVSISHTDGSVKLGTNISSPSTTSFDFDGTTGALSIAGSLSAAGGLFTANSHGANIQAFDSAATWSTWGRALTFTTTPATPTITTVSGQIYSERRTDTSPTRNVLTMTSRAGTDYGISDALVTVSAVDFDTAFGIASIQLGVSDTNGNLVQITSQEADGDSSNIHLLGITSTYHIRPLISTDTYDIGTSSLYYNHIYVRNLHTDVIVGTPSYSHSHDDRYFTESESDARYVPLTRTVTAGAGLTGGGALSANITISHSDTSSQASVDNTGSNFIQDITLDTYGHITAITSADVSSVLTGYLKADGSVVGATSQIQVFTNSTKQAKIVVPSDSTTAFAIRNAADSRSVVNVDTTNNVLALRDSAGIFAEIRGSSALNNLGLGANALVAITSGDYNLGIGTGALLSNTTGANNAAIGTFAMASNISGGQNIAIGTTALVGNTSGQNNIAIGVNAMLSNTTGQNNFGMGVEALYANTTGGYNVAIGASALRFATANYNVAIGAAAGYSITTMEQSVFIGVNAGYAATGGLYNIGIGGSALYSNSTGYGNLAIGYKAGWLTSTGPANSFLGYQAGMNNAAGQYNTFIGYAAGQTNTSGNYNAFIGAGAGFTNSTGQQSIMIGLNAGYLATGSFNTFIGSVAGYNNVGASNVFIGYAAGQNETGSNKLYIANTNTATPLIKGDFSAATLTLGGVLYPTAGSASAPAISQSGDTNTGILWSAADTLGLTTGGTQRVTLSTSSLDTTVVINAAADTDATNSLGRVKLGFAVATDTATFAHYDQNTSTAYALSHTNAGATTLNGASGQTVTLSIGGAAQLQLNSAGIQSPTYVSQLTGWRVTGTGAGDFRYIYTDELHAKAFIADLEQALAGGQIITKSVTILYSDFTAPAASATAALTVRDLPSATGMAVFQNGDIIRLRTFSRSAGSLSITDCWGTVVLDTAYGTSGFDSATKTQRYTFTRSAAPNAGAMTAGTVVKADAIILDYGTSGNGFHEVNAIDGAYGANSPYSQVVTWTTHPATGQTIRTRLGNLSGLSWGVANEFGLYAGNGTSDADIFIRLSNNTNRFNNVPIEMWSGGNRVINITAADGFDVRINSSAADDNSALSFHNGSDTVGYLKAYSTGSLNSFVMRTFALTGNDSAVEVGAYSPDNRAGTVFVHTTNGSGSAENSILLSRVASTPTSAAMTFSSTGKIKFTTPAWMESDLNFGSASGNVWTIYNSLTNLFWRYTGIGGNLATLTTAGNFSIVGSFSAPSATFTPAVGTSALTLTTPANQTSGMVAVTSVDSGSGYGPHINVGRNSNASTPASGFLYLVNRGNTGYAIWPDASGNLRINGAALPTSANDLSGSIIGLQSSYIKIKTDITEWDDTESALDAVLAAKLYQYHLRGDESRRQYNGLVITDSDRGAWFSENDAPNQTPVLNERNLFGYLIAAIQAQQVEIRRLQAKINEQV